jgi:replicative DNA helicase
MIYSYELEKQLLAALIKKPENYFEISAFINEKDFYSEDNSLNKTIFTIVRQALEAHEEIDDVIIAQRVQNLGISFDDVVNVAEYVKSLGMRKVADGSLIKTARELKKYTIRREIYESSQNIAKKMKTLPAESSYSEIISVADKEYNSRINQYEVGNDSPENIYDEMENVIEERGANPVTEFGMMGPHKKINDIYGSLLRPGNITVIVARSGVGKMNPLYTKVLTPTGFVEMRHIHIGSKVICPNGETSTVTRVFDHKDKEIYRIYLKDGRYADCGLEHLWKIFGRDKKGVYNWQIVDTQEIINHLNCSTKRVYLPLVEELLKEDKEFDIHPYCIGAFIGDGCLSKAPIMESADIEIIDKMQKILECEISSTKPTNSKSKGYRFMKKNSNENTITTSLRKLNLIGKRAYEKFIPEIYFSGSFNQRIELLRGLMDTDGTLSKSKGRNGKSEKYGNLSYSTSSEKLAKDIQRLVWSIGGIATVRTKNTFYKKNGEKVHCRLSYRISIRFRNPNHLFFVARKKNKAPNSHQYQHSDLKIQVVKVEKLPNKEDCRCIEIDNSEHLYVIDDYIVTHNTQFCMDYSTKVSLQYNVPVLHFDNGEMSKEELIMRQCSALSGVPMHLIESGQWLRAGKEVVEKVRSVWSKVKKLQFYYYNVGGLDVDSMINTLKRFYYSKVGRGNRMIFSFDYIKTTSDSGGGNKTEWQMVGEMVDKFKRCVQKEILYDGLPIIPMITSVQSNRSGITNNRNSQNVVDDESIVSLSDRITQFCSHMFILRNKTTDEVLNEGVRFGTHKLIDVKSRHLGKDIAGAVEPVRVGDTLRKNFINLEFKNFRITEKGDLRDIVEFNNIGEGAEQNGRNTAPDFDEL